MDTGSTHLRGEHVQVLCVNVCVYACVCVCVHVCASASSGPRGRVPPRPVLDPLEVHSHWSSVLSQCHHTAQEARRGGRGRRMEGA